MKKTLRKAWAIWKHRSLIADLLSDSEELLSEKLGYAEPYNEDREYVKQLRLNLKEVEQFQRDYHG